MLVKSCVLFIYRRTIRRLVLMAVSLIFVVSLYLTIRGSVHTASQRHVIRSSPHLKSRDAIVATDYVDELFTECRRPTMDLWHPYMKQHFVVPSPLHCDEAPENWVYVDNSTFRISPMAIEKHGKIMCEYRPVVRISDSMQNLGEPIRPFVDGSPIQSDFFEARCLSYKGEVYKNLHAAIKPLDSVKGRGKSLPSNAMGLNILMFGFDSVSRLNWMRNLPKSHEYFTNVLNGVTLEGYNIVGDGTPQALLPILTGQKEEELSEARRGFPGASNVDGHPWIWKDFQDIGYATQWGEDGAHIGTFNYRMLGFSRQPTDHYLRPFQYLAESDYYKQNYQFCMGSTPRVNVMLNWVRSFFDAYQNTPKFSFLFHSEFSHDAFSQLSLADEALKQFLMDMKRCGYLNNTMLILMADHGARFVNVRQSQQGKFEERLPYFALRLPDWFEKKYPQASINLRNNAKVLTSPFDIHETFNDVMNYTDRGVLTNHGRGISLFQAIPKNRSCHSAAIAPHWCTCLDWIDSSLNDRHVISSAHAVVKAINKQTNKQQKCEPLKLETIDVATRFSPNENVLRFKKSSDDHGRKADLSDKMYATEELYQVTITTQPGGGKFEATVTHESSNGSLFSVDMKEISRINRYGSQPHCVSQTLPHLRPYCYCRVQLDKH